MWLDEWLFKQKKTVTEFAKELNISRGHANQIVNKRLKAGPRLAKDIEALTEGKVTSKDIVNVKIEEKKK